jgi:predicted permease
MLIVALVAAGASALLAGIVPALRASRADLNSVLQDTGRGGSSLRLGRLSRILVTAEVAFSCALLIAAGLTVRSILAANAYDLRFDPEGVLTARAGLFEETYPEEDDWLTFFEEVKRRVEARPEVASAAIATVIPTDTEIGGGRTRFERPDEVYERPRDMPFARLSVISPGFFDAFGLSLRTGRDFTEADREGATRVAIVNEDFARKEWPNKDPIGQRINLWQGEEEESADPEAGWVNVIGVVPNLRFANFDNEDDQQGIYLPLAQNPVRFAWIVAKTHNDPASFAEALRRTVLSVDADTPLYYVRTMDQVLERTLFYDNLIALLFSIFGLVALVLSAIGLYGVMSFAVSRRIREMGVRLAFGARGKDLVRLVVGQGVVQATVGVVVGIVMGAGLSIALASVLFQVTPRDPVIFASVPLFLVAIAALACLLPARRAAAVDPIRALRFE